MHYEKFSDGTIECIEKEIPYALPKNWKWCRLYQLTEAIPDAMADGPFGSNLKKEHYTNNQEVRIIQLSNIGENGWENHNKKYTTYSHASTLARSCVQQGTIVIAKMMPAGRAIIVPNIENNYILSSDVIKFVPHKKLNKEYLICALNSTTFLSQVAFGAHGVTRIRTSLSKLKEYLVPVPPLPEQNRIVSLFKSANSNIGTIINEKEALLDLLKITKSKILDLAIRGKLVPQDPNDEPASVLLERIRQEKEELIQAGKIKRDKNESIIFRGDDNSYYEKFGDGTIKCIEDIIPFTLPNGWCWSRLSTLCSDIQYGVSNSAENSGSHRLLRITDIQDGKVEWDKVPFTTLQSPEQYRLMTGDIVFARTGATVGKSFLIKDLPFDSVYASYLIRIRLIEPLYRDYIYNFFNSKYYWNQITDKSVGVGQPNCNGSSLKELLIPIPPLQEQIRIINTVQVMVEKIFLIECNITKD